MRFNINRIIKNDIVMKEKQLLSLYIVVGILLAAGVDSSISSITNRSFNTAEATTTTTSTQITEIPSEPRRLSF
jgi:hypothetical protein